MNFKIYRNELKYFVSYKDYLYLKSIFDVILESDFHNKNKEDYWIRSLYFDTAYNSDYNEKVMGIKNRKKVRLRIYEINGRYVKLEIKNRYDGYMLKEYVNISCEDAMSLIKGNKESLLNYNSDVARKVYYLMSRDYYMPSAIVDYEREAYTYPINNIRITFDKNIRGSQDVYGFFEKDLHQVNVFKENSIVLEVKYDNMLPKFIREILGTTASQRSSVSKYCLVKDILE